MIAEALTEEVDRLENEITEIVDDDLDDADPSGWND